MSDDLRALSAGLGRASSKLIDEAHKVIAKGSLNVKNAARDKVSDHPSWKRLANTINYEQVGLSSVIGYDDVGQGELAGIAEFGSARHAPHPALLPALAEEKPRFEKALADAAAKALRDAL